MEFPLPVFSGRGGDGVCGEEGQEWGVGVWWWRSLTLPLQVGGFYILSNRSQSGHTPATGINFFRKPSFCPERHSSYCSHQGLLSPGFVMPGEHQPLLTVKFSPTPLTQRAGDIFNVCGIAHLLSLL